MRLFLGLVGVVLVFVSMFAMEGALNKAGEGVAALVQDEALRVSVERSMTKAVILLSLCVFGTMAGVVLVLLARMMHLEDLLKIQTDITKSQGEINKSFVEFTKTTNLSVHELAQGVKAASRR